MFRFVSDRPRHHATKLGRKRFRPALEILEGRCAPAVLSVNSIADNVAPADQLSLRVAVQTVDGTLGRALTSGEQAQISGTLGTSDTIQFDVPAGPQTILLSG